MTTREKAHKLLDELPESEIEPVIEFIASRGTHAGGPEAAMSGDVIDEWGNLSAMRRASSARTLAQLDAQEAAAGFSWDEHL